MTSLSAVIVNYRTPDLTVAALRSLAPDMAGRPGRGAVVVDNASADGSAERIERAIAGEGWAGWARVVRAPVNGGFSAGNNLGIAALPAERYLLLNSDACVLPGAVDALMAALDADPAAGLAGPALENERGVVQHSVFRNRSPVSEFLAAARTGPIDRVLAGYTVAPSRPGALARPDWLSFACVLVRAEVLAAIGPLDEGFFLYFEDIDFCRRARAAGWRLVHVPAARAVHLHGRSASLEGDIAARRRLPRYYFESRARYFAKHYGGVAGVVAANLMWAAGRGVSWAREVLGTKPPHTAAGEWSDNWINWRTPLRPPLGPPSR